MTKTYTLHRTQLIRRPLADVFEFFSNAANLEAITPPFLNFKILSPLPIGMRPGALIDYQLRLYGFTFRWRTTIESVDPPRQFVDTQARGPYKLWHHTHDFYEVPEGVLAVDRVRYQLYLGPLGRLTNALFVRRALEQIFDHRYLAIAKLLPDLSADSTVRPATAARIPAAIA